MALSAKGEYALIGAPERQRTHRRGVGVPALGHDLDPAGAKLVAESKEETGAGEFGYSVALASKEGNYALIGAPGDNDGIGAAWVFLRSGTTWAQQGAKLTGSGENGAGRSATAWRSPPRANTR